MNCKLIKNIKASCLYNPGGISEIHLLDMRDFLTYRFSDDNPTSDPKEQLYDKAFVEAIFRQANSQYISLETVQESNFTENKSNGLYRQTLSTFVHTLGAEKLESLLLANANRYLVVFRTLQETWFTFASDAGASLEFTQITGQVGETNGYAISITASSIYPLFEASRDILEFKYNVVYIPQFDQCEQAIFVPDFDYSKCEIH